MEEPAQSGPVRNVITGLLNRFRSARDRSGPRVSQRAVLESQDDIATTMLSVRSEATGLHAAEAARRLRRLGPNRMNLPENRSRRDAVLGTTFNFYVLMLLGTAVVALLADTSYLPGAVALVIVVALVALASLYRTNRTRRALAGLNEMAKTTAHVLRRAEPGSEPAWLELDSSVLVTGDIVRLDAGFRVPADVRLIESDQLEVNQSLITGDPVTVMKTAGGREATPGPRLPHGGLAAPSVPNICLTGSFVVSGSGTGVVVATADQTYYGSLARHLFAADVVRTPTGPGVLLLRLLALVPVVLLFRLDMAQGGPLELLLFLLAGMLFLLPELAPGLFAPSFRMAAGLAGPLATMAQWVQELAEPEPDGAGVSQAAQRFARSGLHLEACLDLAGEHSHQGMRFAWLLSRLNTASRTDVDKAVLTWVLGERGEQVEEDMTLVAELPFDLRHRRASLVMAGAGGQQVLVSRGSLEDVLVVAGSVREGDRVLPLDAVTGARLQQLVRAQAHQGFGVHVIASRFFPPDTGKRVFSRHDERQMTIEGLLVVSPGLRES